MTSAQRARPTLLMSLPAVGTFAFVALVAFSSLTSSFISGYGGMASSADGAVGDITAAPGSKIFQRQEEIAQQFRER